MKNLLLSISLIFLLLVSGLIASVFWTNKWDYQLFNLSLDGMCPVIREQNSVEYNGFIKRVCENKTFEQFTEEETKAKEEAFQKSLQWELKFTNFSIRISRMGSGKVEETFWQKKITNTKTSGETLESIHANYFNVEDSFVYDTGMNRYYDLTPGGYSQLRVVDDAEFKKLQEVKDIRETYESAGTIVIHQSKPLILKYAGGELPWKAVIHTDFHVLLGEGNVENKKDWLADGFTVTCYLPIAGSTSYLEIDEPMKSAGSEVNLCDYASEMGIQGVSLVR